MYVISHDRIFSLKKDEDILRSRWRCAMPSNHCTYATCQPAKRADRTKWQNATAISYLP